jgi:hypothetical protein
LELWSWNCGVGLYNQKSQRHFILHNTLIERIKLPESFRYLESINSLLKPPYLLFTYVLIRILVKMPPKGTPVASSTKTTKTTKPAASSSSKEPAISFRKSQGNSSTKRSRTEVEELSDDEISQYQPSNPSRSRAGSPGPSQVSPLFFLFVLYFIYVLSIDFFIFWSYFGLS